MDTPCCNLRPMTSDEMQTELVHIHELLEDARAPSLKYVEGKLRLLLPRERLALLIERYRAVNPHPPGYRCPPG